jgi:hypothetical protein
MLGTNDKHGGSLIEGTTYVHYSMALSSTQSVCLHYRCIHVHCTQHVYSRGVLSRVFLEHVKCKRRVVAGHVTWACHKNCKALTLWSLNQLATGP